MAETGVPKCTGAPLAAERPGSRSRDRELSILFHGPARLPCNDCYDLPASIRGAPDATLRKGRPTTGGTVSILSHALTRVNTDPTKFPICRGWEFMPPAVMWPPEGANSDAGHRSVRRSPSSHAAVLPSRDRAPRFQSRPRLRRLVVTSMFTGRRRVNLTVFEDRRLFAVNDFMSCTDQPVGSTEVSWRICSHCCGVTSRTISLWADSIPVSIPKSTGSSGSLFGSQSSVLTSTKRISRSGAS